MTCKNWTTNWKCDPSRLNGVTTLDVSRMLRSESASTLHYRYICYHFFTLTINVIILKFNLFSGSSSNSSSSRASTPRQWKDLWPCLYSWLPEEEFSSARGSRPSPFQQRIQRNLRVPGVMSKENQTWKWCKEMCCLKRFIPLLFISKYPANKTRYYQTQTQLHFSAHVDPFSGCTQLYIQKNVQTIDTRLNM